jgi:hypothetical protein
MHMCVMYVKLVLVRRCISQDHAYSFLICLEYRPPRVFSFIDWYSSVILFRTLAILGFSDVVSLSVCLSLSLSLLRYYHFHISQCT